ncbi:hypothetical protein Clacol_005101 [Clathrus columnatus]|uniref:GATA-type domain-containing protein n=1 Tax=Clathrus columnatus TaxID=1419009 RepID=A0AAV5ADY4_9AGAM|nr:hypothetical protein Clacol_005101 [Clathrus columnatus]
MQVLEKKQDSLASPLARNLSSPYGEKGNTYPQWSNTNSSFASQCAKQENHSIDMGYDMNVKLNENEMSDFRHSSALSDTWNRFPQDEGYALPLRPQFPSHKLSPSPDSTETPTPPSVPGSLHTLHDTLPPPPYALNSPGLDGFANNYPRTDTDHYIRPLGLSREDAWSKNFADYRVAPSYSTLGLGLNPIVNCQPSGTPMSIMSSYDAAYSYPSHPAEVVPLHSHHFSAQLSRPPTASTSTSSGSSSPSLQGEFYDRGANRSHLLGPHPYGSLPYSGNDWHTCDPRGISAAQTMFASLPSHSPAASESSNSVDGKKPKIRPKRVDSAGGGYEVGLAKSMIIGPTPSVEMMYRVKKKVTPSPPQPVLGMGLEDIDENEIEFTSRQDTKPTRLLRRQCYNCRTWRDVSAWRRSVMAPGHIVCNKCGLYEKAHKRSRPLNDRGEFVRPGKDPSPRTAVPITPAGSKSKNRTRSTSDSTTSVDGAGVMHFDAEDKEKDKTVKDA